MTTQSGLYRHLILSASVAAMIFIVGCSGKKPKPEEGGVPSAIAADQNLSGDSDSGKAMGLQTVHFPYDSFALDSSAKDTAKANADILKAHASVKIQIEGHCDQRGGIQYNIALGEKRANAVKNFMVDQGVSG